MVMVRRRRRQTREPGVRGGDELDQPWERGGGRPGAWASDISLAVRKKKKKRWRAGDVCT